VIEERSSRYAALLLRLTLGVLFIAHLYWKFEILPGGVAKWWSGFQTNGYPWFVPWYVISAEFAGAVLLIPGIYTRWVSLYAIPLMIGATQFWWVRRGFYFTSAGGELPLLWGQHSACSSIARRWSLCCESRRIAFMSGMA
jgi:putative oxidoreductase